MQGGASPPSCPVKARVGEGPPEGVSGLQVQVVEDPHEGTFACASVKSGREHPAGQERVVLKEVAVPTWYGREQRGEYRGKEVLRDSVDLQESVQVVAGRRLPAGHQRRAARGGGLLPAGQVR